MRKVLVFCGSFCIGIGILLTLIVNVILIPIDWVSRTAARKVVTLLVKIYKPLFIALEDAVNELFEADVDFPIIDELDNF